MRNIIRVTRIEAGKYDVRTIEGKARLRKTDTGWTLTYPNVYDPANAVKGSARRGDFRTKREALAALDTFLVPFQQEWEEQTYRDIADELSEPWSPGYDDKGWRPTTLADIDKDWARDAKAAADRLALPWPPVPDVDEANRLIEQAHLRFGTTVPGHDQPCDCMTCVEAVAYR